MLYIYLFYIYTTCITFLSLPGAFLLPYAVMLIIEGIPLLYLELSVGQRLRKGSLKAWFMISPYMGGVGMASVVICVFTANVLQCCHSDGSSFILFSRSEQPYRGPTAQ